MLHRGDRRTLTTKQVRETEAEAVAFVVCQSVGLQNGTSSQDYVTFTIMLASSRKTRSSSNLGFCEHNITDRRGVPYLHATGVEHDAEQWKCRKRGFSDGRKGANSARAVAGAEDQSRRIPPIRSSRRTLRID